MFGVVAFHFHNPTTFVSIVVRALLCWFICSEILSLSSFSRRQGIKVAPSALNWQRIIVSGTVSTDFDRFALERDRVMDQVPAFEARMTRLVQQLEAQVLPPMEHIAENSEWFDWDWKASTPATERLKELNSWTQRVSMPWVVPPRFDALYALRAAALRLAESEADRQEEWLGSVELLPDSVKRLLRQAMFNLVTIPGPYVPLEAIQAWYSCSRFRIQEVWFTDLKDLPSTRKDEALVTELIIAAVWISNQELALDEPRRHSVSLKTLVEIAFPRQAKLGNLSAVNIQRFLRAMLKYLPCAKTTKFFKPDPSSREQALLAVPPLYKPDPRRFRFNRDRPRPALSPVVSPVPELMLTPPNISSAAVLGPIYSPLTPTGLEPTEYEVTGFETDYPASNSSSVDPLNGSSETPPGLEAPSRNTGERG